MNFALWQGYLSFALIAFLILPRWPRSRRLDVLLLLAMVGIGFVPVAGLPIALYLRSLTDDLASTTLVALLFATAVRLRLTVPLGREQHWQLVATFAGLALLLYPATLGLLYFDPYRLGYSARGLLLAIGALALVLLYLRNYAGAFVLTLATVAFTLDLKSSDNYWDYLMDPFLATYCWGFCLIGLLRSFFARKGPAVRSLQSIPESKQK